MPESPGSYADMIKVSLIATLLNEEDTLGEWWESILRQTRQPDEMLVVDGGSQDKTLSLLRALAEDAPFTMRVEVLPGSNIAEGRNQAIAKAAHEIIAVTDGGCVLDSRWLENLLRPMYMDPDISLVAGFYQPLAGSWFQSLAACVTLPLAREVREARFMPSSRSLAFKRAVWERGDGYPEWLDIGEDMYFNHAWKAMGIKHAMAKDALVFWRMRQNLSYLLKQYFLYARGDGESGMYPERHILRFITYGCMAYSLSSRNRKYFMLPTFMAAALYAGKRWARVPLYMAPRPIWEKLAALASVPPLMMIIDMAKMAGYLSGRARRKR